MLPSIPPPSARANIKWTTALRRSNAEFQTASIEAWTFTPDYSIGLNGPPVDALLQDLFPAIGNRGKKAKEQALKCALLALAQSLLSNRKTVFFAFTHSRSNTHKAPPKRYKVWDSSNRVLTTILDALASYGLVEFFKGFKGQGHKAGLSTLWVPTQKYVDWLELHSETITLDRFLASTEPIQLKKANKDLVDYIDTETTTFLRDRVRRSNLQRMNFHWDYLPLTDNRQFVIDSTYVRLQPSNLECRRVFNEGFESGGRFYCSAQNLKKEERKTIRIDGAPTIELDFKSLHPRLLYNLNGLEAPTDCYASPARDRNLTKRISLLSLNCESKQQACKALMSEERISAKEATEYLNAYAMEHEPIANLFYQSAWQRLQFIDSQIVDTVLSEAHIKNIPVLPVHDSFITTTAHCLWIKEATEKAYKALTGFNAIVSWDELPDLAELLSEL